MGIRSKIAASVATFALVGSLVPGLAIAAPAISTDDARAKMEAYGAQLAEYENDLSTAGETLERTKLEISQTEDRLKETREQYANVQSQLTARVRANYKDGSFSLIDVVFGAANLEDLVSRLYYFTRINNQDVELLNEARALRDELFDHIAELEERKEHCEEVLSNVDAKIAELAAKLEEAQSYFNALPAAVQKELSTEVVAQIESGEVETNEQGVVTDGLVSAVTNVQVVNYQQSLEDDSKGEMSKEANAAMTTVIDAVTTTTEPTQTTSEGGDTSSLTTGLSTAIERAYSAIGVEYTYGGTTMEGGFDCSGLVNYAYGSDRGRTTYDMIDSLQSSGDWKTDLSDLEYGDLVFPSEGHVGIYIGDGQMIHAPQPGSEVQVAPVYDFIGGGSY